MSPLNPDYIKRMKEMLGEEYPEYEKVLETEVEKGIRANPLKTDRESLKEKLPESFTPEEIPWISTGLFIDKEARPGKIPEYYTGLFYPQEPSAMIPGELINIDKGDRVLDLCAAPGGKSTQIAGKLGGTGVLVLNEIVNSRVPVLLSNVERMGIKNAIVFNEHPERLEKNFKGYFDKILVDAPCSGEGMFRKDEALKNSWTPESVEAAARRQRKILESADKLLKPGGEIVYSTCTFAPEENEATVSFLKEDLGYEILEAKLPGIKTTGEPDYIGSKDQDLKKTLRFFPHQNRGEGHFAARLKKPEGEIKEKRIKGKCNLKKAGKNDLKSFNGFKNDYLNDFDSDSLYLYNSKLYSLPSGFEPERLSGLKISSPGLLLGEIKKNRFEPSHSLAMALKKEEFKNTYELDEDELWDYLKGLEIAPKEEVGKGWVLLLYNGDPVGFGKFSGKIKNKYPKGLRIYKK